MLSRGLPSAADVWQSAPSCSGRRAPCCTQPRAARPGRQNRTLLQPLSVSVTDRPVAETAAAEAASAVGTGGDANQAIRLGAYEAPLVQLQASKSDQEQPSITSQLAALPLGATVDVAVVGCGPAGLCLAAQLAQRGLDVGLVGRDVPFVNNYGVWADEFKALGLEHTLEAEWPEALCYFGEQQETKVERAYGRVSRRLLRQHLLQQCAAAGVRFLEAEVSSLALAADGKLAHIRSSVAGGQQGEEGVAASARLVTLASGAAAGRFLSYESGAPGVAAQTAYGIEAEVEGYGDAYDERAMLFMDFRRHHSGLWDGSAPQLKHRPHPNAGGGLWGNEEEVPSFLYAMPLGGKRVFLEETCLVAKPPLPFSVLKRRLERRMAAMGLKLVSVHEEEWSFIPVGGPLPLAGQPFTAFGAAANLVHPATGFSVARSLQSAPGLADGIVKVLAQQLPAVETSAQVWELLWPLEKRRQASFQVFGMELLANLDLRSTNQFFSTFFRLPTPLWRGFLSSSLSSAQLLLFALTVFVLAPVNIKTRLMTHLLRDPAGGYLLRAYTAHLRLDADGGEPRPPTV